MRRWLALGRSGAVAVLLHPLRSAVTVASLVAVLLPYVAGLAIARGLLDQARDAIRFGPDLLVEGERLGRPAPVPLEAVGDVRAIPGVREVVPRIVGEVRLGRDDVSAVLVGLPLEHLPSGTGLVAGRLPAVGASHELVVGAALARRLALRVGSKIPPFYRNDAGERVSTVVGVFRSDLPIWSGSLMLTSLDTAAAVFAQRGVASSLLVTVDPAQREAVRRALARLPALGPDDGHGPVRPRVLAREDAAALLPSQVNRREGVFTLHWLLAFAVGLPLLLVTTGAGLAERRRESSDMVRCSSVGIALWRRMKSAMSSRNASGAGIAARRLSALLRAFSSSSTFWKTGNPLSARPILKLSMKPRRLRQAPKEFSSRTIYSDTTCAITPCL